MSFFHRFRGATTEFELCDGRNSPARTPFEGEPRAEHELRTAAENTDQASRLQRLATEMGAPRGLAFEDALQTLLDAIWTRRLQYRPVVQPTISSEQRPPTIALTDLLPDPDVPRPTEATMSFEVRVVDELGEPLGGLDVTFGYQGTTDVVATDADGWARIERTGVSFASLRVVDRAPLYDQLRRRWGDERTSDRVLPSDDTTVIGVRDDVAIETRLLAQNPHILSLQPDVRVARLFGFQFDPERSFLLPTAVPHVRGLAQLHADHRAAEIVVVGHAAPGESDDPEGLAMERATSVSAYLRDDVDAWLGRYEDSTPAARRWGPGEDRSMLRSLPDFPDKPGGETDLLWFQRTRGLAADGIAGPLTRARLIGEYMAVDGTSLPPDVAVREHSCGESFPAQSETETAADRHSDREHRRVELVLFGGPLGVLPEPQGSTSTSTSLDYPQWMSRAQEVLDLSAPGSTRFVAVLEVADVLFRTNSCVVAPEGEDPSATGLHASLSSIGVIATALRFAGDRPEKKLLVAGHCDTTASPAFNQPLSEERAQVVLARLVGDRQRFVERCHARHRVADYKQMLSWVSQAFEPSSLNVPFDCHPGVIDEQAFTAVEPIRRFQAAYNRNRGPLGADGTDIAEDGAIGPQTWGAMFDCLEHGLRSELDISESELAARREALDWVDEDRKSLGFSEHHPIDSLGRDGFSSQANRRVEILFFDPGEEPDLDRGGGAPEMSEIYLPGRYQRRPVKLLGADDLIAVRLCEPLGEPIADAPFTVQMQGDVHTGVADSQGLAKLHVPADVASLVVTWTDPRPSAADDETFTREVRLSLDEADHDRLTNLGYEGRLDQQLRDYRFEFERSSDTTDDALLGEIRAWHDGGQRPDAATAG